MSRDPPVFKEFVARQLANGSAHRLDPTSVFVPFVSGLISPEKHEMARVHRGVKWVNVLFACQEVIEWVGPRAKEDGTCVAENEKESRGGSEARRAKIQAGEDFPRASYIDFHRSTNCQGAITSDNNADAIRLIDLLWGFIGSSLTPEILLEPD